MSIKKFHVSGFGKRDALFGAIVYPVEFKAEIEGNEPMDELVKSTIREIPEASYKERKRQGVRDTWIAFDGARSRIPYSNKAIDDNLGVAGFVLLNEESIAGGKTNIDEGVYGIRKDGDNLRGRLIEYGHSGPDGEYIRHVVNGMEEGILKGQVKEGDLERNLSYNLTEI